MSFFILLSLLQAFANAQSANFSQPGAAVPCEDVHIFLARGNNEPYPGRQGKLVTAICNGLSSCSYEDVQFYNPYEASYAASVQEGAVNGVKQVTAYADACPESQIVLSGYSQGANVMGDVLGGGYGVFFHNYTEDRVYGLDAKTSPGTKIKAVILFGDTRHTAGQTYNVETGAEGTGLFPRPTDLLETLNQFAPVMRSYCVKTDPICAPDMGPEEVETHLNYFEIFSEPAAAWVKSMLDVKEGNGTKTSTSTGTSPSKTAGPSSETSSTTTTEAPAATSSSSETGGEEANIAGAFHTSSLAIALGILTVILI